MTNRDPQQPPAESGPGRRDVEKRWSDPSDYRAPTIYGVTVIVIAMGVLAAFAALGGESRGLAAAVPGVFLAGGIGGLILGVRAYARKQSWVPWQGVAWFLLILMLGALVLPLSAW